MIVTSNAVTKGIVALPIAHSKHVLIRFGKAGEASDATIILSPEEAGELIFQIGSVLQDAEYNTAPEIVPTGDDARNYDAQDSGVCVTPTSEAHAAPTPF